MGQINARHASTRIALTLSLCFLSSIALAQQPGAPATPPPQPAESASTEPLPPVPQLLLSVEANQKAAEAAQRDYTYHEHVEVHELNKQGDVKKTTTQDYEAIVIDGVNVQRLVARDGKPLSASDAKKEDERIDKDVAKAKARREKRTSEAKPTDSNGDDVITASRMLELGTFTNPRRVDYKGRPTIVVDYAGDPHAKTRNPFETVVRDLVGTVWIDEQDKAVVRSQGHFLSDFKIGGGLLADIKSGTDFDFYSTKINNEVWLPASIISHGKIRFLLFIGFDGNFNMVMSDYKKFRTTSTIIDSDRVIGPDGQPVPEKSPATPAPQPQGQSPAPSSAQPPTQPAPQAAPDAQTPPHLW